MVELYFDVDYEERVNGVNVSFLGYRSPVDALRQLGYSQKTLIKHRYSSDAWYFITREYLPDLSARYRRNDGGHHPFRRLDPLTRQQVFYAFNNTRSVPLVRHKLSSCKNRVHLPP